MYNLQKLKIFYLSLYFGRRLKKFLFPTGVAVTLILGYVNNRSLLGGGNPKAVKGFRNTPEGVNGR